MQHSGHIEIHVEGHLIVLKQGFVAESHVELSLNVPLSVLLYSLTTTNLNNYLQGGDQTTQLQAQDFI